MSKSYEYTRYGLAFKLTEVDITKVPEGSNADDYGVMEKGKPETAVHLLGWDEVGLFDHEFKNPVYIRNDSHTVREGQHADD